MKRGFILVAMFAALALSARPAYAWDDFGHRLVARIAWENMTPHARARAIAILRGASHDTGLQGAVTGPLSERQQMELFVFAATWPDVVRDTAQSLRMEKYHHPTRHFLDTFWMQSTDFGPVQPSPLRSEGDLVRDVPRLNQWLVNGNAEEKALALAWLMHLVGDIHQPLHASGRVTPTEPCGDQGGNLFTLEEIPGANGRRRNLHSLWDGIITTTLRREGESPDAFLTRAEHEVTSHHPRGEFSGEIGQREFGQWAQASVAIAQRDVYRAPLVRNQAAPAEYREAAFHVAEARIALAGYRLADMLNQALGH
jgi:hypothetical protein